MKYIKMIQKAFHFIKKEGKGDLAQLRIMYGPNLTWYHLDKYYPLLCNFS
jgi:hypothetical protein